MTRVGLFVDADNLLPFWRPAARTPLRTEGIAHYIQKADFVSMLRQMDELVAAEGAVVFREAYGTWANSARRIPAGLMYHEYGYDLQHVPPLARSREDLEAQGGAAAAAGRSSAQSLKNAGDILLSVRAVLASTREHALDTVVVGAADKDYHQLVTELKRLGKRVVCLAFPQEEQQGRLLSQTFDDLLELDPIERWDELDRVQNPPRPNVKSKPQKAAPAEPTLAVVARPSEPTLRPKIKDPFVLARRLWERIGEENLVIGDAASIAHLDFEVDAASAARFESILIESGVVFVNFGPIAVEPDAELDSWKLRAVEALVEALLAEFLESADLSALPPADQLGRIESELSGRFQSLNPGVTRQIAAALGRHAIGLADGTPPESPSDSY